MSSDIHLPQQAVITDRVQESPDTFTMRLSLPGAERFHYLPGQFNTLYLYGVGEVPISIVPHGSGHNSFDHTIRVVGRVTGGLANLRPGTMVGIRGPFGRGWPLDTVKGQDILLITGGLGNAPLVGVMEHLILHRSDFGRINLLHGVKQDDALIWHDRYAAWNAVPDIQVFLAAETPSPDWPWHQGTAVDLLAQLDIDPERTDAMLCGPEAMMLAAIERLHAMQLEDDSIWVSLERNMQCGIGQCGHCQLGQKFVCKDGPVFSLSEISGFFGVAGV